jgi:hypothetical protein
MAVPPLMTLGHGFARAGQGETTVLSDATREALLADARAAWQYFEQPGPHIPGLVPANTWQTSGGFKTFDSYRIATMWDVGSMILATASARSLGIIDEKEFATRVRGLNRFLTSATYRYRNARLPNFRSSIDNARSVEAGYDATDTARLFVALNVLDSMPDSPMKVRDLVRSWDLDATIKDGQIYGIKRGGMEPATFYIYRYYVSRAYAMWGIKHDPVTSIDPSTSDSARTEFLKELAGIGSISSEPSLSEEVEIGASVYSRVITDVLGHAQEKRYKDTGKLTCVSESPVDQEPWFTYQGYDLTQEGEAAWTVYSWNSDPRWTTPEFANRFRMVSTKAAYLWYATQPSPYTEKLWQHVREKARAPRFGFHPGVYESSGRPPNNVDVNTNATVLEAVAYALKERQPLLSRASAQNVQPG